MNSKTNLIIHVDIESENKAKKTLDLLGITTPSLIQMLYSQIALTGKIPVELRSPIPGLKDLDLMSDEEDEEDTRRILQNIKNGRFLTLEEFNKRMHEKYGF